MALVISYEKDNDDMMILFVAGVALTHAGFLLSQNYKVHILTLIQVN